MAPARASEHSQCEVVLGMEVQVTVTYGTEGDERESEPCLWWSGDLEKQGWSGLPSWKIGKERQCRIRLGIYGPQYSPGSREMPLWFCSDSLGPAYFKSRCRTRQLISRDPVAVLLASQ